MSLDNTTANTGDAGTAANSTSVLGAGVNPPEHPPARRPLTFWLPLLLGALALVFSAMLWEKLSRIQGQLARQSADAGQQSLEAKAWAKQAQDTVKDSAGRMALLESRLSEATLQRSQLEELIQSLSRSRDENLVLDIESSLRLAQQQAQLAPVPHLVRLRAAMDPAVFTSACSDPLKIAVRQEIDQLLTHLSVA